MEEKKYYCRVCGKELEPKYNERFGRKIVGHHTFNIFEYEEDAVCCSDCWPFIFYIGTIQEFINDLKHYNNDDLIAVKEIRRNDAGFCACFQRFQNHLFHVFSRLFGIDQRLREFCAVKMSPRIVDADHDKDVIGMIGKDVVVKTVQKHFRCISADGGVEIMNVMCGEICPCIHENTGYVAGTHFSEAVADGARSVAVGNAVAREHYGFDLIHKDKPPFILNLQKIL